MSRRGVYGQPYTTPISWRATLSRKMQNLNFGGASLVAEATQFSRTPRRCALSVGQCRLYVGMKAVRQFALILAVLFPLVMPAMVCVLPNAHLSRAERACCKRMNGQCGSMEMPATHSCCQTTAQNVTHWTAAMQPKSVYVPIDLIASPALLQTALLPGSVAVYGHMRFPVATLSQSPPSAINILRI